MILDLKRIGSSSDVGHPPFSHGSEEIMPLNSVRNKPSKHEDYITVIIKNILKDAIETHPINRRNCRIEAKEVAALIEGNTEVIGERIFWRVLISSQLDADRGDYLLMVGSFQELSPSIASCAMMIT